MRSMRSMRMRSQGLLHLVRVPDGRDGGRETLRETICSPGELEWLRERESMLVESTQLHSTVNSPSVPIACTMSA